MIALSQKQNLSKQIPLPVTLTEDQKRLQLYIGIFFVNGNAFFHTKSKPLNYVTVYKLHNKTKGIVLKTLQMVITMYLTRGFIITDVYTDNKFDNAKESRLKLSQWSDSKNKQTVYQQFTRF